MAPRQKRLAGNEYSGSTKKKRRLSNNIFPHNLTNDEDTNFEDRDLNSEDNHDTTPLEQEGWKPSEEAIAQADNTVKANQNNAIKMKEELKERRASLLKIITQYENEMQVDQKYMINTDQHSKTDQKAFENNVWPILRSALVPVLTTEPTIMNSGLIAISQAMSKETHLFREHDKVLSEARRLNELLTLDNMNTPPPSRIPEFIAGLEVDKSKVLHLIRAGKKTATWNIQQKLKKQEYGKIERQIMSKEDEQAGKLLMRWGTNGTDAAIVHNSALGKLTTGLTKAMSHLEKLFKNDAAR